MSATMESATLMKVIMSEELNDDWGDDGDPAEERPFGRDVFAWLVGNQEVPNQINFINFTEPSDGLVYLEVLEANGLLPGIESTLSFQKDDVMWDDYSVSNPNTTGPDEAVDVTPWEGEVAVDAADESLPTAYALEKNFPNPFNPSTTIQYSIPVDAAGHVELVIYNMTGQKVRTLVTGAQESGYYNIVWDGTDDAGEVVASGIYLYKLVSGDFSKIEKMTFIK